MIKKLLAVIFGVVLFAGFVSAVDVAYIVSYGSGSSAVMNVLDEMSLSYDVISDSEISSTNFEDYSVLLVGEDSVHTDLLPWDSKSAVFFESDSAEQVWNIDKAGSGFTSQTQRNIKVTRSGSFIFESIAIPETSMLRVYAGAGGSIHYISLKSNPEFNLSSVAIHPRKTRPVIVTSVKTEGNESVKDVFVGLPDAENWDSNAEKIVQNALVWTMEDVDQDGDGVVLGEDCNDHDDEIYPGAEETPYDGIDQDCDGADLTDVDGDGYDSDLVFGLDCDDNDPAINPDNPDPLLNCVNDPVEFAGEIPDFTLSEDHTLEDAFDLNDYFSDPDSELSFSAVGDVDVEAIIVDGVVSFEPAENFKGLEEVYFVASDGDNSADSNVVKLTVVEAGEPPVFDELVCETVIDEDVSKTCVLGATDEEGNEFEFSVSSEDHLSCSIEGNVLTYVSYEDYNGDASCVLQVTDIDGSDFKTLEVEVMPVNDAPEIVSATPDQDVVIVLNGESKLFVIEAEDVDSDHDVSWTLNSFPADATAYSDEEFFFFKSPGNYNLRALVSDGEFSVSRSWNVVVGETSDFDCDEIGGIVCGEGEVCGGELIDVKDVETCCSTSCMPSFEDADSCSVLNSDFRLEITDPEVEDDNPEIGDTIRVRLEIKNNWEEDQDDVEVEFHLYNLDEDRSEDKVDTEIDIDEGDTRVVSLDLEIPEDLETEDSFVIFAKVDGEICNQIFQEIEIDRPDDLVVLSNFEIPSVVTCGDYVEAKVKVENAGKDDQDVTVEISNRALGIDEESDEFELERYGEDDSENKKFVLEIPADAGSGTYSVEARVVYGSHRESLTKDVTVECSRHSVQASSVNGENSGMTFNVGGDKPNVLKRDSSENVEGFGSKKIVFIVMMESVLFVSLVLFGFVVLKKR